MEIKYKLYPYPVLSSYSNDYGNGAFDVAIDIVRDGYDLRIDFLATLTCQSLQDCIKQGVAKFVYHLECAQTGFRTVVQTDKVSEVYTLLNKAVNGKLQICPFVVAVDDLKGFFCDIGAAVMGNNAIAGHSTDCSSYSCYLHICGIL